VQCRRTREPRQTRADNKNHAVSAGGF
jgi:hypothetical protein